MHTPATTRIELEICASNYASALAAQDGGADRIELCENLAEGGCTPSLGMISEVRAALHIGVHVLVRPRGGDFVYSAAEKRIMLRDIEAALAAGADGIVCGALTGAGEIDSEFLRELRAITRGRTLTFHRAFDVLKAEILKPAVRKPDVPKQHVSGITCKALETLVAHGVDRLLTSGRAARALDGAAFIAQCVRQAGEQLRIMAGAGVSQENLLALLHTSGVHAVHTSAKTLREHVAANTFATLPGLDTGYSASDAEIVRGLRTQLDQYIASTPSPA